MHRRLAGIFSLRCDRFVPLFLLHRMHIRFLFVDKCVGSFISEFGYIEANKVFIPTVHDTIGFDPDINIVRCKKKVSKQ